MFCCRKSPRYDTFDQPADLKKTFKSYLELSPGTKIVLWCRESVDHGHLKDQIENVTRLCRERGLKILKIFSYVGSGKYLWAIQNAALFAEEYDAVLVGETWCRYGRPFEFDYHTNQNAVLLNSDVEYIAQSALRIPLYTINDPDAAPSGNRSYQIRRGNFKEDIQQKPEEEFSISELKRCGLDRKTIVRYIARNWNVSLKTAYKWYRECDAIDGKK